MLCQYTYVSKNTHTFDGLERTLNDCDEAMRAENVEKFVANVTDTENNLYTISIAYVNLNIKKH